MTLKVVREHLVGLNDPQQAYHGGGKATDRDTAVRPHPGCESVPPWGALCARLQRVNANCRGACCLGATP